MQVVYFSQELQARAPGVLGCLFNEDTKGWVSLIDVAAAIERRENVTVRPATETEMKRAEAVAALFDIGVQLGQKVEALLDQETPEVVRGTITAIREAMESVEAGPADLLDRKA
ncbi:hypothetical protein CR105_03050 [Massilia eurypsychrophila]|uniref:Uncharacterized protein n=1 Tax=Massilia eurypsychrophila TaxID=1485217 RepID=A0A2G8TJ81_9BURK|nr:hypothetical protein [Massilia eurypsychrophila]PIL46084.1 hypothetical protein CR105_03050 [Massilia eurypsychrophila]